MFIKIKKSCHDPWLKQLKGEYWHAHRSKKGNIIINSSDVKIIIKNPDFVKIISEEDDI